MLSDKARAELERRGPAAVRETLRNLAGGGQASSVNLEIGPDDRTSRGDCEQWLREQDAAAAAVEAARHAEQLRIGKDSVWWAKHAALVSWAALAVTVVSAIVAYLGAR